MMMIHVRLLVETILLAQYKVDSDFQFPVHAARLLSKTHTKFLRIVSYWKGKGKRKEPHFLRVLYESTTRFSLNRIHHTPSAHHQYSSFLEH